MYYIKTISLLLFHYRCDEMQRQRNQYLMLQEKNTLLLKKSKLSQSNDGIILLRDLENLHKCSAPFVSSAIHRAQLTAITNNAPKS